VDANLNLGLETEAWHKRSGPLYRLLHCSRLARKVCVLTISAHSQPEWPSRPREREPKALRFEWGNRADTCDQDKNRHIDDRTLPLTLTMVHRIILYELPGCKIPRGCRRHAWCSWWQAWRGIYRKRIEQLVSLWLVSSGRRFTATRPLWLSKLITSRFRFVAESNFRAELENGSLG